MAAMAFAIVWILISVHVPFLFGYVTTKLDPSSFPVGKSNATIKCLTVLYAYRLYYEDITLDIRQNENEDFISVLKCNLSGEYRLNNETDFKGFDILSFNTSCWFSFYFYSYVELNVSLQSDECILGSQTSASWRCLFSNGTFTFNTSEKNIYSIKGQFPQKMESIFIVNRLPSKSMYETGDVLQLQCIGEIESINSMPSKDIRWCRKENGKFKLLSFQDPPRTNVVKRSKDGCTVVQNSTLFYHISQNDTAFEIMCESGWSNACGIKGINATLNIPTIDTQPDKWRMLPILIHDKTSLLNPRQIVLDGPGKTIHLQCTASVHSHNTSIAKIINWCVRKQNNATWTEVKLQGKKKVATSNISGEITVFSKVEYHITVFDTDVHFLCEISHYSSCGNGLASSNLSIHVAVEVLKCSESGIHRLNNKTEFEGGIFRRFETAACSIFNATHTLNTRYPFNQTNANVGPQTSRQRQNQYVDEPADCSEAAVVVLSVLLAVVLIFTFFFMLVLCRWRQISLFGMVIKIESEKKYYIEGTTNNQSLSAIDADINRIQTQSSTRYVEKPSSTLGAPMKGIKTNSIEETQGGDIDRECYDNSSEYHLPANYDIPIGKQSFYENQALEHERKGSIYEDATKEVKEQNYDVLKL